MKKKLAILITLFAFIFSYGQNCGRKVTKGTTYKMSVYNRKGKVLANNHYRVTDVKKEGSNIIYVIESKRYDKKNKLQETFSFEEKCIDGRLYANMKGLVNQINTNIKKKSKKEDVSVEVKMSNVEFPTNNTKIGTTFKNAYLKIITKFDVSYIPDSETSFEYQNRKVEKIENKETPAGIFKCLYVVGDVKQKFSIIKRTGKIKEWYSGDTGLVYSEFYNKKGKLISYSVLTDLKIK